MAPSELRIIVTGAAGLLGRRLVGVLAKRHRVFATIHRNALSPAEAPNVEVKSCDLVDGDAVARLLDQAVPDVVINCAAMTDVDGCEGDPQCAERLNSGIVENLLRAAADGETRIVQISTDYIFDGKAGPYPENSPACPLNVYGNTKLAGESAISAWGGKSLILRTSALYDCGPPAGKADLFTSTYDRLDRGERVTVASDLFCNPIWVLNLAEAIAEAIDKSISGILNIAGPEYLSRCRFSRIIAAHYGFATHTIDCIPVVELGRRAIRPLRAGLDISRASTVLRTRLLSPNEAFSHPDFDPT